jgi:hypothetical protein
LYSAKLITYHDTEAEAERARQESIAILDTKVLFAGDSANDEINADERSTEKTCYTLSAVYPDCVAAHTYATESGHNPASRIIVERHRGGIAGVASPLQHVEDSGFRLLSKIGYEMPM